MNELITVFYSLTGLALLLWIMMVEYPRFQLEKTREKLYGLRQQLIYTGEKHQILDQRACVMVRYMINGMLHYIDNFSFFQFLAVVTTEDVINKRKNVRAYKEALEDAYKDLSHEATREIDDVRDKVNDSVISYMLKTSPIALPLIFVVALFFMTGKLMRFIKYLVPAIEANAEKMGEELVYGT